MLDAARQKSSLWVARIILVGRAMNRECLSRSSLTIAERASIEPAEKRLRQRGANNFENLVLSRRFISDPRKIEAAILYGDSVVASRFGACLRGHRASQAAVNADVVSVIHGLDCCRLPEFASEIYSTRITATTTSTNKRKYEVYFVT